MSSVPPPSEPDRRISRIRLSSRSHDDAVAVDYRPENVYLNRAFTSPTKHAFRRTGPRCKPWEEEAILKPLSSPGRRRKTSSGRTTQIRPSTLFRPFTGLNSRAGYIICLSQGALGYILSPLFGPIK